MTSWSTVRRIGLAMAVLAAVIGVAPGPRAFAQAVDPVTRAREALAADRVDEAIGILEAALGAAPNDPATLATLGNARVLKSRSAPPMEAAAWVHKGFETLDEAVRRFPQAFVVYVARGVTAARVPEMFGKAPVAVKDLTTVVAMREGNPHMVPDGVMPSVYLHLGTALKKTGALAEARAAWEEGRRRYPAAPETRAIERELEELGERPRAGFPNVIEALRAAPGCLGVETAQTTSGRRVIFAWFEDKKALVDWYYSEPHQAAMKRVFPDLTVERAPLADLAEDSGPILAIVSVKFTERSGRTWPARPIASIGIELYGPLPGGIALGGRFAPAALRVPGLREFDAGAASSR
jgi:tetratricopeptide (TPR) repeat protein